MNNNFLGVIIPIILLGFCFIQCNKGFLQESEVKTENNHVLDLTKRNLNKYLVILNSDLQIKQKEELYLFSNNILKQLEAEQTPEEYFLINKTGFTAYLSLRHLEAMNKLPEIASVEKVKT